MFDLDATRRTLAEAITHYQGHDAAMASRLAITLGHLQGKSPPERYVWTEHYSPTGYFTLTVWVDGKSTQVASLTPQSHDWVQYCGRGWNLTLRLPSGVSKKVGQLDGFEASCAYLRALAKQEWGCPLSDEESRVLAGRKPKFPWA